MQRPYFNSPTAIASRQSEVPLADFAGGMNPNGSNAGGIGIGLDNPNLSGEPDEFTLLDQDTDPRTPQNSQFIGGIPLADGVEGKGTEPISVTDDQDENGEPVRDGSATLASLAAGWTAV